MASLRGARDFVARFVTDLSRFDTREVVEGYDDIAAAADDQADAAVKAGRKTERALDDTATEAGRARGRFGAAGEGLGDALTDGLTTAMETGDPAAAATTIAQGIGGAFSTVLPIAGQAVTILAGVLTQRIIEIANQGKASAKEVQESFDLMLSDADAAARFTSNIKRFTGKDTLIEALEETKRLADEGGVSVDRIKEGMTNAGSAKALADELRRGADEARNMSLGVLDPDAAQALDKRGKALGAQADDAERYADAEARSLDLRNDYNNALGDTKTLLGQLNPGNLERAASMLSTIRQQIPAAAFDPAVAGGGRQ